METNGRFQKTAYDIRNLFCFLFIEMKECLLLILVRYICIIYAEYFAENSNGKIRNDYKVLFGQEATDIGFCIASSLYLHVKLQEPCQLVQRNQPASSFQI